jgi:hypothetical protein
MSLYRKHWFNFEGRSAKNSLRTIFLNLTKNFYTDLWRHKTDASLVVPNFEKILLTRWGTVHEH